jgi:mannose-6-phosphate isomerase-like protein (cupin superfamily)
LRLAFERFGMARPTEGYQGQVVVWINKITPYTSPYDNFSAGIQVLEPGAHIRRHGHERSHEILFCFRGSGTAEIDGKIYDVHEETMMLIGRRL